jgi:hypothetical protein
MLAMTPAQCGQELQRNAGKDTCAASAGPSKANHCGRLLGRTIKPWAMMMSTAMTSHTPMCRDCVITGQTPACNAGSNEGAMRVTTPTQ